MADFTTFRKNVQEMFARELGVEIKPGNMEGPNETPYWLGSLYLRRWQEDAARPAEANTFMVLRVFQPLEGAALISPNSPFDPTELEIMGDKILDAVKRNPVGLGQWYQRVQSLDIDTDVQGIQATIFSFAENPGQ